MFDLRSAFEPVALACIYHVPSAFCIRAGPAAAALRTGPSPAAALDQELLAHGPEPGRYPAYLTGRLPDAPEHLAAALSAKQGRAGANQPLFSSSALPSKSMVH